MLDVVVWIFYQNALNRIDVYQHSVILCRSIVLIIEYIIVVHHTSAVEHNPRILCVDASLD